MSILLVIILCLMCFGAGYAAGRMDGIDAGIEIVKSAQKDESIGGEK